MTSSPNLLSETLGKSYAGYLGTSATSDIQIHKNVPSSSPGSKNQTNPLKERGALVWFFMHFRRPKAVDDMPEGRGIRYRFW